jgi:hypothetical protein
VSFFNRNKDRYQRGLNVGRSRRNDAYLRRFGLYQSLGGTFSEEKVSDGELLECATNEPLGYRLTYTIARDTVNCGFNILKDDGITTHNYNNSVQDSFKKYDVLQAGAFAYQLERIFGRSWLVKIDPDKHQKWEGEDIIYTAFSNPSLATNFKHTWDRYRKFQPVEFNVKFGDLGEQVRLSIDPEDYYFLLTRPVNDSDEGISILQPCWNDLVNLRTMRVAFTERVRKYGGFPHIKVVGGNDYVLQQAQEKWGDFDELKEAWSNEETDIDMKGLGGVQLDPNKFLEPYIRQVAISSETPMPILSGMESGQLKSGQINLSGVYALISNNQSSLTDMGRWMSTSVHSDLSNFRLDWNLEYAISDIDRLAMRQIEVDNAVKLRPYITDKAFARILEIDEKDVEKNYQEKMNPFGMGSPFGGGKPDGDVKSSNPATEEKGRKFGEKKDKKLRGVRGNAT